MNVDAGPIEVDVRGLVCPEPVVRTRAALEANPGKVVRVLTDSTESRDNIGRFAQGRGYEVSWTQPKPGVWAVEIRGSPSPGQPSAPAGAVETGRVILIAAEEFGSGSPELGQLLMQLLLRSLGEVPAKPGSVVLVHGGVRLATEGSPVLDALQRLEQHGVTVRVCGTCLDYYGLKDRVRVGQVSNMFELVEVLLAASGVVRV